MTGRREFVGLLGALAAGMAVDPDELRASAAPVDGPWDTSWLNSLAAAKYRAVFNANEIGDGIVFDYVTTFLDHYHEAHGTKDQDTRPVAVFRRLGTSMAFNDVLWDKYQIGEDRKVTDPETKAPARRNIFWRAERGAPAYSLGTKIQVLRERGLISLVCNVSITSWTSRISRESKREPSEVRAEILGNLIPGAIVVPSGIYGILRAQNAGCAYMQPGS